MNAFALALAAFVIWHIAVPGTGLRGAIVSVVGESRYKIGFALLSAALLVWMIVAFGQMRADPHDPLATSLWTPPLGLRHLTYLFVLLGFVLAIAGLLSPKPTPTDPARGMARITRHPVMWGVALWAFGHLLANGERYSIMLFGALGVMALLGARSIDRKNAARDPETFAALEAVTSNVPFAAIVQGRNTLVHSEIPWRALVAVAAFGFIALLHQTLIGVPVWTSPS